MMGVKMVRSRLRENWELESFPTQIILGMGETKKPATGRL